MDGTKNTFYRVTTTALEARVRRRLAREGETLRKCRSDSRWYHDLGDHYAVNDRNCLVRTHIDLEELARELGAISPVEWVAS